MALSRRRELTTSSGLSGTWLFTCVKTHVYVSVCREEAPIIQLVDEEKTKQKKNKKQKPAGYVTVKRPYYFVKPH